MGKRVVNVDVSSDYFGSIAKVKGIPYAPRLEVQDVATDKWYFLRLEYARDLPKGVKTMRLSRAEPDRGDTVFVTAGEYKGKLGTVLVETKGTCRVAYDKNDRKVVHTNRKSSIHTVENVSFANEQNGEKALKATVEQQNKKIDELTALVEAMKLQIDEAMKK